MVGKPVLRLVHRSTMVGCPRTKMIVEPARLGATQGLGEERDIIVGFISDDGLRLEQMLDRLQVLEGVGRTEYRGKGGAQSRAQYKCSKRRRVVEVVDRLPIFRIARAAVPPQQIGSASCRERVCQEV